MTTTLDTVVSSVGPQGLIVLGGLADDGGGTILLLGPDSATFWEHLQNSPEAHGPNPVDHWSRRVITDLAQTLGARARFPFGTPMEPFVTWALASGTCHLSPVGLLVHEIQGLNVSFRGALHFDRQLDLPPAQGSPCATCAQPCLTACPVSALGPAGYDLPACHSWLDDPQNTCMSRGCAVRRACPVSPPRPDAQAAHHMAHFHREER